MTTQSQQYANKKWINHFETITLCSTIRYNFNDSRRRHPMPRGLQDRDVGWNKRLFRSHVKQVTLQATHNESTALTELGRLFIFHVSCSYLWRTCVSSCIHVNTLPIIQTTVSQIVVIYITVVLSSLSMNGTVYPCNWCWLHHCNTLLIEYACNCCCSIDHACQDHLIVCISRPHMQRPHRRDPTWNSHLHRHCKPQSSLSPL